MIGHIWSFAASNLLQFVISLYILHITNSALAFTLSLAIIYISQIVTLPIAGVVGDRVDRKKMIVSLDFINSIFIISLAAIVFTNISLSISLIYFVIVVLEVIEILYNSTMHGVIPLILEKDELDDGNRLKESIDTVIAVISPFLAALLFTTLELEYILTIVGVMYAFCGLLEMKITLITPKRNSWSDKGIVKAFMIDFLEGINYIKNDKIIKSILVIGVNLNFFVAVLILGSIYFIIKDMLNLSGFYVAIYQITQSVFILIGLSYISPKIKKIKFNVLTKYMFLIIAIFLFVIAYTCYMYTSGFSVRITFGLIVVSASIAFTMLVLFSVRFNTIIQQTVNESILSRVRSSMHIIYVCIMPLGMLLIGLMLDNLSIVLTTLTYAVAFSIASIIIILNLKNLDI